MSASSKVKNSERNNNDNSNDNGSYELQARWWIAGPYSGWAWDST